MSAYGFYAATLRFVARRSDRSDPRVGAQMAELSAAADALEAGGRFRVAADRLDVSARAFAGVAALLQQKILPETVAHGHAEAERQVRWSVDASMAAVNRLLQVASLQGAEAVEIVLPPPPAP